METTRKLILGSSQSFETHAEQIRAGVFGELVTLAAPIIQGYHSDLYHDARWITQHVNGPTVFYFVVRPSGTTIGYDLDYVSYHHAQTISEIRLTRERYAWYVETKTPTTPSVNRTPHNIPD